ncbi:MAG: TPM domain-containing protein [Chromatiales bacterium]|nr:TPM domain-containing protein [Chromatiales bacterium]
MATRQTITEVLAAHEKATGNQLVVVTLKSLNGMDIADYGYQLGRHWGIGRKDRNNGVLLIVVPNERKVRIEVGYGLEGALTDALSRTIIDREILPRFKAGDYPNGVKQGVDAILAAIKGEYEAPTRSATADADQEGLIGFVAVLGAMVGSVFRSMFASKAVGLGIIGGATALAAWLTGAIFLSVMFGVLAAIFLFSSLRGGGGYYGGGSGGGYGGGFGGGGGSFGGGGASGSW